MATRLRPSAAPSLGSRSCPPVCVAVEWPRTFGRPLPSAPISAAVRRCSGRANVCLLHPRVLADSVSEFSFKMLCECPLMSLVGLTAPPSPPVCFLGLTRRVPRFYMSSPVSAVVIRSAHRSKGQPPPLGPLFMSAVADMAGVHRYPPSRLPLLCDGAVCPLALPRVFFMVLFALFARL